MLFFQQCLPIIRKANDGTSRVIQPASAASAEEWGMTLAEAGQSCKALMDHAMGPIPEFVLPSFQRGKVASLYLQGVQVGHADHSFLDRPVWPNMFKHFWKSSVQNVFCRFFRILPRSQQLIGFRMSHGKKAKDLPERP